MVSIIVEGLSFCKKTETLPVNNPTLNPQSLTINLRWIKAYPTENWYAIKTGIAWAFSFLGAELPQGCLNKSINRKDSSLFSIDLSNIGFNDKAKNVFAAFINNLKSSGEYKATGAIDLGRFIVLCQHSS